MSSNISQFDLGDVSKIEWDSWAWQMDHRIKNEQEFARYLDLTEDEKKALRTSKESFPVAVTPYYLQLCDKKNPDCPIRKTIIPSLHEWNILPEEMSDPLGEDPASPVPGLVHRYPHKVLFLTNNTCATYCRYCVRSRMVGNSKEYRINRFTWERCIDYIEQNPSIHDVLLSGGDPLQLPNKELDYILKRLCRIKHLDLIRIGTKMPTVAPQRVDHALVDVLTKYRSIWLSLHMTHPKELTKEFQDACHLLAKHGVPLGSQSVILKDVNDNPETLAKLFRGLLRCQVKPYYLYHCDLIKGSGHFRTSLQASKSIYKQLWGRLSGYAIPKLVVDLPGGGGKLPILPDFGSKEVGDERSVTNFANKEYLLPQ